MDMHLEPPIPETETETDLHDPFSLDDFFDDSNYSTPFVSAPSSPSNRASGSTSATFLSPGFFFYSAPTSPVHYSASAVEGVGWSTLAPASSDASSSAASFEFEFSSRRDSPVAAGIGASMSSADELFLNGQIRPMKLCAHLSRPQIDENDDDDDRKPRDLKLRNRSQRRRTRSMSPLRNTTPFEWILPSSDDVTVLNPEKSGEERENDANVESEKDEVKMSSSSASSSRCSSAGRSSKRWLFLKEFLRSKSEGRSNNKFWQNINISFSPSKEKEKKTVVNAAAETAPKKSPSPPAAKKPSTAKRRSAHEVHYEAKRAQAEEMRRKTFLPYRQGLLGGCLGFNSKGYGTLNGFAKVLNPVSSR